jgi:uncharacterized protein (TIGR03437 family)
LVRILSCIVLLRTYIIDLGTVRNSVQAGVPAAVDSPNPINGTFTCRFPPQTESAKTEFAGLAPGLIGIYQVSLRMPQTAFPGQATGMTCTVQTSNGAGTISVFAISPAQ